MYKALPESVEAHELKYTDNFPDHTIILKAKLTQGEFDDFIDKFNIGEMENENWEILPSDPDWWNPSTNKSTLGAQLTDHNGFISVKYEDGFMYSIFMSY